MPQDLQIPIEDFDACIEGEQQRRFPDTRRADDTDEFSFSDREVDIPEYFPFAITQMELPGFDLNHERPPGMRRDFQWNGVSNEY
jgi:hypothetical protein